MPSATPSTSVLYAEGAPSNDANELGVGEVGFDIKYGITPSLTLDLTYNTDFAQVEADDQQVNLTRFPLFFPEKRPFFLWYAPALPAEEIAGALEISAGSVGTTLARARKRLVKAHREQEQDDVAHQ